MNGKSSRLAARVLSVLMVAQGALVIGGVSLVVLKDRMHSDPVLVRSASLDAEGR